MARRSLLLVLSVALVIGLIVSQASPNERYYKEFTEFAQVLDIVTERYVTEVKPDSLFQNAYEGMLQSLDPYSQFLPREQFQEFSQDTSGKFGGLGIEIGLRDGILTVITPIAGTPAWKAGIISGDRILAIDGKSTERIGLQEAIRILRGAPGTQVTITVRHPDSNVDTNITIVRGEIKTPVTESRIVNDVPKIGMIRVHSFTQDVMKGFNEEAEKLGKENIEGFILDLRGNPGGILEGAVGMADSLLEDGVIVTIKGRDARHQKEFKADKAALFHDVPMVVLVDMGTASASEIVAAALQGNGRALIVGTPTFGKGAVQNLIPVGEGAIKLTTAMYYTPTGSAISRENPVEPDVTISMTADMIMALRQQQDEDKMRAKESEASDKSEEVAPDQPAKPAPSAVEGPAPLPDEKIRRQRARDIQLDGAVSIISAELRTRHEAVTAAHSTKLGATVEAAATAAK